MLRADGLTKVYRRHAERVTVLDDLNIEVAGGEFVSVLGASGSGKSTLLHILGTLDRPDTGTVTLAGRRIDNLPSKGRDKLRNGTFGFIFQFYHLMPELSALENVTLPAMIGRSALSWWRTKAQCRRRAKGLLERVGLGHRLAHRPKELSGGEMQRAAVARALINDPTILLADEPTGNLDAAAGGEVMAVLRDLNGEDGVTIIMVTHNLEIVASTDRVLRMHAGRIGPASPPLRSAG